MADDSVDNAPDISASMPQPQPSILGGMLQNGPAPTLAPQPEQPHSRLNSILAAVAGVVGTGLAAGAAPQKGRPSFAGGLAAGAAAQQQMQFKSADDAIRASQLTAQSQELRMRTQEAADAHDTHVMEQVRFNEQNGMAYDVLPNDHGTLTDYMKSASAAGGIQVPPGTLLTLRNLYVPKQSPETDAAQIALYRANAEMYGMPSSPSVVPAPLTIQALNFKMMGLDVDGKPYSKDSLPQRITVYQQQRASLAQKDTPPAVLANMDRTIGNLQAQLKSTQDNETAQKAAEQQAVLDVKNAPANVAAEVGAAGAKAGAEAKARLPYEMAKAKADESLKDGDPNSAAQLLVNGDVAPSQLISSRKPAFAQQAFDAAKKINPQWNAQQAEGYYKAAGASQNVTFFGSAKSLTDKNGTLDQLQQAYNKLPNGRIPALNTVADWAAAAAGSGSTAGFAQTAIGVADDYAKVMGGGQGSDTSRNQVLESFARSHSPQAMASAISAARPAVDSQMNSRIGTNPVMRRMYGDQLLVRVSDPQGGQHTFRTQQDADAFKKTAGIQ